MLRVKESEADTMNHSTPGIAPSPDRTRELRAELARKIALFMGSQEKRVTDVPGLILVRLTGLRIPYLYDL